MTPAPSQQLLTVSLGKVLYIPTNLGMDYYNNDAQRGSIISTIATDMNQILTGLTPLISAPSVPSTLGLTLYRTVASGKQFIDVNNMNINPTTDTVTPQLPTTFTVEVPAWLDVSDLRISAISPDGAVSVSIASRTPGQATINLGTITHYASIVMDFPDADGDLLSDATEATLGTNPNRADTDGDGLSDYAEINFDGNPAYTPGSDTNPLLFDTDGDGVSDLVEIGLGFDPLNSNSFPTNLPFAPWGLALAAVLIVVAYLWNRKRSRFV